MKTAALPARIARKRAAAREGRRRYVTRERTSRLEPEADAELRLAVAVADDLCRAPEFGVAEDVLVEVAVEVGVVRQVEDLAQDLQRLGPADLEDLGEAEVPGEERQAAGAAGRRRDLRPRTERAALERLSGGRV